MLERLPAQMRCNDDFLVRFVRMFQQMADTHLEHADQLEHVFDPAVAPDAMVRVMGRWIGLDLLDPDLDDRLQREVVLGMAQLAGWSGTRRRVTRLLELITGEVEIVDSGGVYREGEAPGNPPHVTISVPSTGWVPGPVLQEIVEAELPASVTLELHVRDRSEVA